MSTSEIKYYTCKGRTYVTKAGEIRQYKQTKAYIPRGKKFDVLLNNEDIKKILNDTSKTVKEREETIQELASKLTVDFTYDQIKNFVYRNAKPQFNF